MFYEEKERLLDSARSFTRLGHDAEVKEMK